jgi:autotransporter-associated beta strand protein
MANHTTFEVNDVTPGTDLTIRSELVDDFNGSWSVSALVKTGDGTLAMTANNGYSGSTTVSGGVLDLSNGIIYSNAAWGVRSITVNHGGTVKVSNWGDGNPNTAGGFGPINFGAANIVLDNGTIEYVGGAASGNMDRSFTIGAGGATLVANGSATWEITTLEQENPYRAYGLASNGGLLTLSGSGNGLIRKAISGSGGLTKTGNGTWTLTGANSYIGTTTVHGGTLSLGNGSANTNLADTANLILAAGATLHLNYSGTDTVNALTVGGVAKPPGIYSSSNSNFITGPGTLTVLNTQVSDYDAWSSSAALAGGPGDDDDHDGLTNFEEYAFGLDPRDSTSTRPLTSMIALKDSGTLTYTRRKTSLTGLGFSVRTSTDLNAWTEDTGAVQTVTGTSGNVETVLVSLSSSLLSNSKLFVRISAQ